MSAGWKINFTEPLKEESGHFINCIRENTKPIADGRNGMAVVQVLEAASTSRKNQGRPTKI